VGRSWRGGFKGSCPEAVDGRPQVGQSAPERWRVKRTAWLQQMGEKRSPDGERVAGMRLVGGGKAGQWRSEERCVVQIVR
jgi:hypothetical protein